jgi:hypothetical protein
MAPGPSRGLPLLRLRPIELVGCSLGSGSFDVITVVDGEAAVVDSELDDGSEVVEESSNSTDLNVGSADEDGSSLDDQVVASSLSAKLFGFSAELPTLADFAFVFKW